MAAAKSRTMTGMVTGFRATLMAAASLAAPASALAQAAETAQPSPPVYSLPPGEPVPEPPRPRAQGPSLPGMEPPRPIEQGEREEAAPTTTTPPPSAPLTIPRIEAAPPAERTTAPERAAPRRDVPVPDPEGAAPQPEAPSADEPPAGEAVPAPIPSLPDREDAAPAAPDTEGGVPTPLWILLGLLVAGGIAFLLFRRRRATAEAEPVEAEAPPRAAPAPRPAPPAPRPAAPAPAAPAPAAAPAAEAGSGRMQMDFQPIRARQTPFGFTIGYRLVCANVSEETLTDVAVDLAIGSAGPGTPDRPGGGRQAVSFDPLAPNTFGVYEGELRIEPQALRPIEVKGRQMLVPIIELKPRYRDAAGALHEAELLLIVGRESDPPGGRMGPFWLRQAFADFDGLGARQVDPGGIAAAA